METEKVRVIDVLTDAELKEIEECETNIIMARTPFGIRRNRRRALSILENAKSRFASHQRTLSQ